MPVPLSADGSGIGSQSSSRPMNLTLLDWTVIALYFLFNLGIGLYYARRARGSTERILSFRPRCALVAGRHVDGCHDVCGRHAAAGHRAWS